MIVYQATKSEFSGDVLYSRIEQRILQVFKEKFNHTTSKQEIASWKNSMQYMDRVLNDPTIPDDCGVAIEYRLPQSAKRLDFILTGLGEGKTEYAILIELKQWEEASISVKDGIVNSFVGGNIRELPHPSYQAWSYASLLQNFNETITTDGINLQPCVYLHNYVQDDVITNDHYKEWTERAPVFLHGDAVKLRNFIKQWVKYGDTTQILYRIDQGKIRPSKMLADSLASMLKGNKEFVMIDDQKVVYETALQVCLTATYKKKKILIVKGGPGTGKSVVAINLLVKLTKEGLLAQYVSKNAAPRAVYENKLTGTLNRTVISNLFGGAGRFVNTATDTFDSLIVDEAHRLAEKAYMYAGKSQVRDVINAAKSVVFFIDEAQRVHIDDAGTIDEIRRQAALVGAEVEERELASQFRCNGSDGYLAWLDNVLQIRPTANETLDDIEYDFKIFSSPIELRDAIFEKNKINNKSRLVAGYCWEWPSQKSANAFDIVLPDSGFRMKWNLKTDGSLWIVSSESVNEVGCIHTCQGLEVDYVGVIVGNDLIVRDGLVLTNPAARAKTDRTVFGYKKLLKESPEEAKVTLRAIIKNTYRTLMTRGMKGCYVYFTDVETEKYFRTYL